MKCLLFLFIFFIIGRVSDGQSDLESEYENSEGIENDKEHLEDKLAEKGDIDNDNFEDERKESKEVSPKNNMGTLQESDLESDRENKASKEDNQRDKKTFKETMKRFATEMAAGEQADLIGNNPHTYQSNIYTDLGRRFIPQYKYTAVTKNNEAEPDDNELVPQKAPPELVLVVAKESALLGRDKSEADLGNVDMKKILRSGDYWNGVWKENVKPKHALRAGPPPKKVLGSIKAKIKPGSEFYKVVSRMKKISPRLLYIINKKQK